MSDLLGISSNAVMAYQRALGTVSNNIANVHTEGYVRQETELGEATPRKVGTVYIGSGVRFDSIKRSYDEFLEKNLRNTTSELNTQQPMVDFANRIVDLMGSDTVGLPPALDKFFATSQQLSTDPASTVLRAQFLRDADGLAGRFRELSSQMATIDTETRESTNQTIEQINTLATQIALVNKQLGREVSIDRQSPQLLDQRDLLLKNLSKLVKLNVTTAVNGTVDLSLTNNGKAGVIVEGQEAFEIGAIFDEHDLGRVTIVLDPYGSKETVPGIGSGQLGGLLTFREQMLQPTMVQLDFLAQTLVDQINTIHTNGIDLGGKVGTNLLKIDQVSKTDPISGEVIALDRAAAGIRLAIDDPAKVAAAALFRVIENDNNLSNADATLSYAANYANPVTVPSIASVLKNNSDPTSGINAPSGKLLGQIPLGSNNWNLYLDGASNSQQLQIFTRDGRQLVGAPLTDSTEAQLLVTENNGFFAGSTYSTQYLNQSGDSGYKQVSVFYGLQAKPIEHFAQEAQFTQEHDVLPSVRTWVENYGNPINQETESIPANTLTINGKLLPQLLATAPSRTIQASDIANWMNRAAYGMVPTVAVNALTTATTDIVDPTVGMYVNGVAVPADASRTSLADLATYINNSIGSLANVEAEVIDSKLVLRNAIGYGGRDILVGEMDADKKLVNELTYKGILNFSQDGGITIGYGPNGKLGDLEFLGKPVGNYYTAIKPREYTSATIDGVQVPSNVDSILGDAITINGKALGPLDLGRALQASDMTSWINSVGSTFDPPVIARASTKIVVPRDQFKDNLSTGNLSLNGVSITGTGVGGSYVNASDLVTAINLAETGNVSTTTTKLDLSRPLDINGVHIVGTNSDGSFASESDLIDAINAQTSKTGVVATQVDADITLRHQIGGDIVVGPTVGVLSTTAARLDLTQPLVINGVNITGSNADGSFTSTADLLKAINTHTAATGVSITQTIDDIVLTNKTGISIKIGPTSVANALGVKDGAYTNVNALGVTDGTYSKVKAEIGIDKSITLSNQSGSDIRVGSLFGGNVLAIGNGPYRGTLTLESQDAIRVGFGVTGNPAELAKLGFRTSAYIDGAAPEDLLVFVTGEGSGTVAGSFDATMKDPVTLNADRISTLRAQNFDVTFTSDTRYQITWTNPQNKVVTILAERDYDPKRGVEYQGLKFTLNKPPVVGDTFRLDGDHDGTGNNQVMLEMIALKSKKIIGGPNGSTISESYSETVGKAGNFSNQATIAQTALQVVNDHAVEARDRVSGVSLDNEAADLIRFQQAYQASAKAMQTANTLFDSILQIS
ncbi:MAG: flagellar hook-associated protein FlgK [bacterium]|jgi:flagellar hook-associated protein 1 FlgK